jgi:hypothetical protein
MQELIELTKVQVDQKLKNELNNSRCTASVLNPEDGWCYVSAETDFGKHQFVPGMNSIFLPDFNKLLVAKDLGKLGESEWKDKLMYGIWNQKHGWDEQAKIYHEKAHKAAVAGGEVAAPDYSGIETSVMTAIVYGLEQRRHVLQNALRTVDLQMTVYEYPELTSRVTINRNITYGDNIPVKSVGLKHNKQNLKCDAAHFSMFDDVRYRPFSVDIWRTNLEAIGEAFILDSAQQVAETLKSTSIPAMAGTDWGDITKNPYLDIAKAIRLIDDNDGTGARIALHGIPLAQLAGNPNAKTLSQTSQPGPYGPKTGSGVLYFGLEHFEDSLMDIANATIWDPFYIPELRGPRGTANYRDVPRFANGYLTFEWKLIFIANAQKARRITGISLIV